MFENNSQIVLLQVIQTLFIDETLKILNKRLHKTYCNPTTNKLSLNLINHNPRKSSMISELSSCNVKF